MHLTYIYISFEYQINHQPYNASISIHQKQVCSSWAIIFNKYANACSIHTTYIKTAD